MNIIGKIGFGLVWILVNATGLVSIPIFRMHRPATCQIKGKIKIKFCRVGNGLLRDVAENLLGKRPVFLSTIPHCLYVSAHDYDRCYPAHLQPWSPEQAALLTRGLEVTFQVKRLLVGGYGAATVVAVCEIDAPPDWSK